jgi:hypothetical protein
MLAEGPSLRVRHLLVLGLLGRHPRLLGPLIVSQCEQMCQPLSRSRSRVSEHRLDEV